MSERIIKTKEVLTSLRKSVGKALERKRRLGQYAIVSKNGRPTRLEPEDIKPLAAAEDQTPYNKKD